MTSVKLKTPSVNQRALDLEPRLGTSQDQFIQFCKRLEEAVSRQSSDRQVVLESFRKEITGADAPLRTEDIELLFASSVILDLVSQNWGLTTNGVKIQISPPP